MMYELLSIVLDFAIAMMVVIGFFFLINLSKTFVARLKDNKFDLITYFFVIFMFLIVLTFLYNDKEFIKTLLIITCLVGLSGCFLALYEIKKLNSPVGFLVGMLMSAVLIHIVFVLLVSSFDISTYNDGLEKYLGSWLSFQNTGESYIEPLFRVFTFIYMGIFLTLTSRVALGSLGEEKNKK